jgi:hypothetical protein
MIAKRNKNLIREEWFYGWTLPLWIKVDYKNKKIYLSNKSTGGASTWSFWGMVLNAKHHKWSRKLVSQFNIKFKDSHGK